MMKWLRRLALAVAGVALILVVLRVGFGLHVYMDGDFRPHLAFGTQSAHYDALEAQRAAQRAAAPDAGAPRLPSIRPPAAGAPGRRRRPRCRGRRYLAVGRAAASAASPPAATAAADAATPAPASSSSAPAPPLVDRLPRPGRATAYIASAPSRRPGRPADRACCGSNRLAKATPRSWRRAGVAYTIEQRRDREVVAAYDIATGRERWTVGWEACFSESMGGDGPRATPTYADGILYALGAAGELRALRADSGAAVWRTNILRDAGADNLQWGMSASPLDRRRQGDRAAGRPRRARWSPTARPPARWCGRRSTISRPTSRRCW